MKQPLDITGHIAAIISDYKRHYGKFPRIGEDKSLMVITFPQPIGIGVIRVTLDEWQMISDIIEMEDAV